MTSSIHPPFFILIKNGRRFRVEKEVTTSDKTSQKTIIDKCVERYGDDIWIIPGREATNVNIGDILTKREIESFSGISIEYMIDEEEELTEVAAKKKIRVLKGKRVVQYRCPPGHHKRKRGGRTCVRTAGKRKYKVKRGAKKAARKRKARKTTISRKRGRSMRKRRGMGLS